MYSNNISSLITLQESVFFFKLLLILFIISDLTNGPVFPLGPGNPAGPVGPTGP